MKERNNKLVLETNNVQAKEADKGLSISSKSLIERNMKKIVNSRRLIGQLAETIIDSLALLSPETDLLTSIQNLPQRKRKNEEHRQKFVDTGARYDALGDLPAQKMVERSPTDILRILMEQTRIVIAVSFLEEHRMLQPGTHKTCGKLSSATANK